MENSIKIAPGGTEAKGVEAALIVSPIIPQSIDKVDVNKELSTVRGQINFINKQMNLFKDKPQAKDSIKGFKEQLKPLLIEEKRLELESKKIQADNISMNWIYESTSGKTEINEINYAHYFIKNHDFVCINGKCYSDEKEVTSNTVKNLIQEDIAKYITKGIANKVDGLYKVICNKSHIEKHELIENVIHVKNGTITVDLRTGEYTFTDKKQFSLTRLNASYNADIGESEVWQSYLNDLLIPEDIPTIQEYYGYMLIPSTAAQRALFLIGSGGEGKSINGSLINHIWDTSTVNDKVHKIETDRFIIPTLEGKLVFYEDDLNSEKMTSTGTFKDIVTAIRPIQGESKGVDKRAYYPKVRFFACGNQSLGSQFDTSDAFYRRLIILSAKRKDDNRKNNPFIKDEIIADADKIFNWALQGLIRLIQNNYEFTISERSLANLETAKNSDNNIIEFLKDSEVITFDSSGESAEHTKHLQIAYALWCGDGAQNQLKQTTFTKVLRQVADSSKRENFQYRAHTTNRTGNRNRGYEGIRIADSYWHRIMNESSRDFATVNRKNYNK